MRFFGEQTFRQFWDIFCPKTEHWITTRPLDGHPTQKIQLSLDKWLEQRPVDRPFAEVISYFGTMKGNFWNYERQFFTNNDHVLWPEHTLIWLVISNNVSKSSFLNSLILLACFVWEAWPTKKTYFLHKRKWHNLSALVADLAAVRISGTSSGRIDRTSGIPCPEKYFQALLIKHHACYN